MHSALIWSSVYENKKVLVKQNFISPVFFQLCLLVNASLGLDPQSVITMSLKLFLSIPRKNWPNNSDFLNL